MGSWSFVTTVQHMQVVLFIGPDDRAVMMVAPALPVQALRFGETAILRIIGDDHGIGAALVVRCGFGVPIVNDIEPLLQIDGLRPLPAIVEHLDFPSLAEGQNPGVFVKGRGVGADRNANRHEDDAKKDAMLRHSASVLRCAHCVDLSRASECQGSVISQSGSAFLRRSRPAFETSVRFNVSVSSVLIFTR